MSQTSPIGGRTRTLDSDEPKHLQLLHDALQVIRRMLAIDQQPVEADIPEQFRRVAVGERQPETGLRLASLEGGP